MTTHVMGLTKEVRAAVATLSNNVEYLLTKGDVDAAKQVVVNAATNPTGGLMTDAAWTTFQTGILALFPA